MAKLPLPSVSQVLSIIAAYIHFCQLKGKLLINAQDITLV